MFENKHLTILYPKGEAVFSKTDFFPDFSEEQITLVEATEVEPFDGRNTKNIPSKTTHLIMHFLDRLSESDFKRLSNLYYVGTCSTGWWDKYFDIDYMKQHHIALDINATYAQNAVAEGVFAALLSYARYIPSINSKNWNDDVIHGFELYGKTFGIIGMGRIGMRVKAIAEGFNMRIINTGNKEVVGTKKMSFDTLLSSSDIISFHIPKSANKQLTEDNIHLLKSNVTILNSSGFELINIEALKNFLINNPCARYIHIAMPDKEAYDILNCLPNADLYPLFTCFTKEADSNRKIIPINNLKAFLT